MTGSHPHSTERGFSPYPKMVPVGTMVFAPSESFLSPLLQLLGL